jgi:hypothetical protein
MGEALQENQHLGRPTRAGTWHQQGVSTYRRAAQAIGDGRLAEAAELGRFTMQEALEGHDLYGVFIDRAREFLRREGISADLLSDDEERIRVNLRLADGSDFDAEQGWAYYGAAIESFVRACEQHRPAEALALLERARVIWRQTHDRACDWVYGLIDVCARHLGEERVVDLWDHLMAPYYPTRDRYDIDRHPWSISFEILMIDALESLRGHLSGPGRLGDIEVVEEEDRWALRFDPCGSGGRTYRGDPDEGGPPRMEPPYNYAVTTAQHDWAWNKVGICLYCVHCCQLQERIPIARFGYPVRVVEPPSWPEARSGAPCTWYIYKDASLIPPQIYERVGAVKPARLGSHGRTNTED